MIIMESRDNCGKISTSPQVQQAQSTQTHLNLNNISSSSFRQACISSQIFLQYRYKIQNGKSHDPCEDAVAAIRLYKRMRSQRHNATISDNLTLSQLSLQEGEASGRSVSTTYRDSHFYCWCLDSKQVQPAKVAYAQSWWRLMNATFSSGGGERSNSMTARRGFQIGVGYLDVTWTG